MSAYDDHLLWEVIFPKYLTQMQEARVLEVGSAPGEFLVQFARRFGCIPHGLDYSEVGVEVNKQVFGRNGFNPGNVIYADFFSDQFRKQYRESYDVVISRGFIEHFTDVESVIERHMDLLKPGGRLIISIPNLRGINYVLADLFDKEAIPRHNTEIMRKTVFKRLFDRQDLEPVFCDYYGTFSFYLFTADQSKARRSGLKFAHKVQPVLNGVFRMLFGNKGRECRYFSPSLLYIGSKQANAI
jgi:SAM-dependent methyltransferase